MEKTVVLGVLLGKRQDSAAKFQEIITKHGCSIKTRIGLHHADANKCPIGGVILLDLIGEDAELQALEDEIKALPDVNIQKMVFLHS